MAADACYISPLVLPDLSTVFDIVDHQILLIKQLQTSHHITDGSLNWLKSYLEGRFHSVRYGALTSPSIFIFLQSTSTLGICIGPFAVFTSFLRRRNGVLPADHMFVRSIHLFVRMYSFIHTSLLQTNGLT